MSKTKDAEKTGNKLSSSECKMQGSDLETIVTLLELGAISLTNKEGDLFTESDLIKAAQEYGGDEIKLDVADVKIVLPFFRKVLGKRDGRYYLK